MTTVEITKKEVDKLRRQVYGLWFIVVLLVAIIVAYPPNEWPIYDRLDKIDDVQKDLFANQAEVHLDMKKDIDSKIKKLNVSSLKEFEVMHRELLSVQTNLTELVSIHNHTKTLYHGLSPIATVLRTYLEGFNRKVDGELTDQGVILLADNLTKIEKQLETVYENISNILSNMTCLVSEHNQTKTLCNSLTSKSTALNTSLKDLKIELDNNLTVINDAVEELVTNLTELNTSIDTLGQTFTTKLDKTFKSLDNKIEQVTNEHLANHAFVMEEFKVIMDKINDLSENLMKIDKATNKVEVISEVTSLLRLNALNKTNVLIVVSVIFFLLFALAFWIYNLHNKINNKSGTNTMML